MEIRYKRTFSPARGQRYTAGEIAAMLGYAMEVAEPRLKLKEGKLGPGETAMLLFGITPEEYALKDSDPAAMDALAEKLGKQVPSDRLLGWRILDLKGSLVQKVIQPVTGDSIDDGAYSARLREKTAGPIDDLVQAAHKLQQQAAKQDASEELKQQWLAARQALGSALMNLEETWVAYDALSGDRWPAVGFDGRIEIFTLEYRARRIHAQIANVQAGVQTWSLRKLNKNELLTLLQGCAGDGLALLRVDNGFSPAELTVKDCCMHALQDNAVLRSMMLREIQYGLRYNRFKEIQAPETNLRGALEGMLTLRGFTWREIGNGSLYALCAGALRDKCVVLGGKDGGEKLLAVFTEARRGQEFAKKLNNPALKPVEMKFDELMQRCDQSQTAGLLIDYGFIGYRLGKDDFEKVLEMRGKPPVIVRVQDEKKIAAPVQQDGLPNPDEFDLPAPRKEETPAAPQPDPDPQPPKRGGFLKKLFKK